MGLDVYAGTLVRYYTRDWKTAVQQWAEENGYDFSIMTPDGERMEPSRPDPDEVRQGVGQWQRAILDALLSDGSETYLWPEDGERPYYTDKPDWDAFGALLLYAACKIGGMPLPPTVEKGWAYYEHPAIQQFAQGIQTQSSLFFGAQMWLPLPQSCLFQCQSAGGNDITASTTGMLQGELAQINEAGWRADAETIFGWAETEGYPVDRVVTGNGPVQFEPGTQFDTESLAKFAFSILYQALCFSKEHQVPIILDY